VNNENELTNDVGKYDINLRTVCKCGGVTSVSIYLSISKV
jgi:hypothetical protein